MRILAINGSHRGDRGHTRFLVDRLVAGATREGGDCTVVTLAGQRIRRCVGCNICHTESSFLRCVYGEKDDVRSIFDQMAAADLIVYATPVYVFGMSGLLKTFLDRLNAVGDTADLRLSRSGLVFHHVDPQICSKPFVSLVCCDNLENVSSRNVIEYFRVFAEFMDAPLVGELARNAGRLTGYGHDPRAAERFPKITAVYAAYEQAGGELATGGRIRPSTQRRANQEIIPIPLFGVLKRLPFKPVKRGLVARARAMQAELGRTHQDAPIPT